MKVNTSSSSPGRLCPVCYDGKVGCKCELQHTRNVLKCYFVAMNLNLNSHTFLVATTGLMTSLEAKFRAV